MSLTELLSLAGLALLDSTSIGTLFVPVWLLLSPTDLRVRRILLYLATLAAAYLAVGLALSALTISFGPEVERALEGRPALWGQLALGVGMFALSFRFDPKRRKAGAGAGRWRERALSRSSAGPVIGLALLVCLVELVTMLPYLGAIAMITTASLDPATTAGLLLAYCVVMVAPALLLTAARVVAEGQVTPLLGRLDRWIATKGAGATGWLLAIAGFLVARDAAARLWFPHLLGQ